MRTNLGRTPRTEQSDRDYFRRPELNTDIDPTSSSTVGYKRMMRSVSVAEIDAKTKEKHSELEKPYTRGIKYDELQSFHPSNWPSAAYSFPGISPDINPTSAEVGDCEDVWAKCLQQVCGNPTGCSGSGVVQQMQNCAGDCSKPHKDILSCLQLNSLCFCLKCNGISSIFRDNIDCDQPQDQGCQDLICSDEPCPSFTLTGNEAELTAPVTLCPATPICASRIESGTPQDQCVFVPNEGCGTKNVCVTDACGNQVCKQVRMSTGVWVTISTEGSQITPGCFATGCQGSSISISEGTKTTTNSICYSNGGVPGRVCVSSLGGGSGCTCDCTPSVCLAISRVTEEWRCA